MTIRSRDDDLLLAAQREVELAQSAARAAVSLASDTTARSRSGLRFADDSARAFGVAAPSAASYAAESARAAERAAFLLDIQLKLSKSTNTFRAWQQVPAWILGASGIGLSFILAAQPTAETAGWVTVSVIFVLAVVASFRGPANVRFGPGGDGGDGSQNEGPAHGSGQAGSGIGTGAPAREQEPPPESGRLGAARPRAQQQPVKRGASSDLQDGTRYLATGRHYTTRAPLVAALDGPDFAERLRSRILEHSDEIRHITHSTSVGMTLRGERERVRAVDLGDPRAAGWTFLVSAADPQADEIIDVMRPLAQYRGMRDPGAPLVFDPSVPWAEWLTRAYQGLEPKDRPHYVLVIGGPQLVPFHFQALLDSTAATGRVAFEQLADLSAYADKLLRLEQATQPATRPEAVFFAPDAGPGDPTYFSRRFMAEPLKARMAEHELSAQLLAGEDATKANLGAALRGRAPALVYTASHGAGAPDQPFDVQRQVNGSICCQDSAGEWLFSAADIPGDDEPFLEGAAFFQFACYGYGTPRESDFMHWLGEPALNCEADFVAALPTGLLRHPRGPVAYVGHVDTAWLHGFDDPENPEVATAYSKRLRPFQTAVDLLVTNNPAGLALDELNKRFDLLNGQLVGELDRLQRGDPAAVPELAMSLADTFIFRSDAQNHMLLGDPAARVRIGD